VLAGCAAGHPGTKNLHAQAGNHPATSNRTVARNHTLLGISAAASKGTIDAFIATLQARAAMPFEAMYLADGKVGPEIVYAVRPGGLLFSETGLGRKVRRTEIVVNGSGEYLCKSSGHARWTCQQLGRAGAAVQNKTFGVYTAAHWAAYLKGVAFAAGAKVSTFTSRAVVPGLTGKGARDVGMHCLNVRPAGRVGANVICAAAPGVLGPVVLCTGPTSFLLESYDPAPSASLFQLPAGARVTRLKAGQQ
jgi:hypothetical protein